jgi:alkanesulfonate monooxygenase SsuD/methylene tetrahydromethanopterin reductase-like flavin-dependent oxidoreductase (luciferase family)
MHVGMASVFQNPQKSRTDRDVYRNELRLADLAEPLGFESVWGVEHHFTDYTMCPDVLQFLTYVAGRTERAQLGSMVVVLPWHDPMRVAEEVSMLDNISDGRLILGLGRGAGKVEFDGFRLPMDESRERFVESAEMLLQGLGRGAGKVEFDGFRLPMDESRERFVESAEMLLQGLERGYCEYAGTFVKQPRAEIRPAPFKSFRGRTYAAAVSPDSLPIMARLGVGILIIPQKPWHEVAKELETYRGVYRQVNGVDAPPPVSAGWTFCDPSAERAREMARRYIGGYYRTVLDHYHFEADHLAKTKGYEYYGKMSEKIAEYGTDTVIDYFVNLQVSGTPEQCYDKILDIHRRTGNSHYVGVFSYAGMPYEDAERNMRLFAREVMPQLRKLDVKAPAAPEAAVAAAGKDVRALGF